MFSLYAILGLDEGASEKAVKQRFEHFRQKLSQSQFPEGSPAYEQSQRCLKALEDAYSKLSDPERRKEYEREWKESLKAASEGEIQPKLGQLCVAAGMITIEELEKAVQSQTALDLPLGQILQEQRLISQAELDGILLGQQLIRLPADSPHSIGGRLIALGLVTEDMVRIALIERRTFDKPLEEILVNHGWLDKSVLGIILDQQQAAPKA